MIGSIVLLGFDYTSLLSFGHVFVRARTCIRFVGGDFTLTPVSSTGQALTLSLEGEGTIGSPRERFYGRLGWRTMLSMSLTLPMRTARDTSAGRSMVVSSWRVSASAIET